MRHLLAAVLVAACVRPCAVAEEAKPNTLTPREIADGWILLFDGETTLGWKSEGEMKAASGALVIGGDRQASADNTSRFGSFQLSFHYQLPFHKALEKEKASLYVTSHLSAVEFLSTRADTWNAVAIEVTPATCKARIRYPGAKPPAIKEVSFGVAETIGRTGVRFRVPAGCRLSLRSVKLQPLDTKPLFNGKDLAGWKEFPGKKSKFTVTKEGWLNVKNGPGDLQTEGKYDDFILQLECISNGKHLNSGIFFRCIADQYQNGYEAQIQNGYKDNDRAKPVDFGTGAIYRRVPARKVVSNDHEWFTLTVVAHGNHLATWVNGYQTVDWTDERPPDDNPRKGSKTGKGHISIQGHDPTTDLSFRNLRMAELPGKK